MLNEIDIFNTNLTKDYVDSINNRVSCFIDESVFNRQKDFFTYFQQFFFFGTAEDRLEEINDILKNKLELLKQKSFTISHNSLYNSSEEEVQHILTKNLKLLNRFLYFEHFFIWYGDFFSVYQKAVNTIMKESSYLNNDYKYYLALSSVCAMKNSYFVRLLEEQFLFFGGDENWLIGGVDAVPNKLNILTSINLTLAFQPWKLTADDIIKMKQYCSMSQIVEAFVIMMQFHALALIENNCRLWKKFTEEKGCCSFSCTNVQSNNNYSSSNFTNNSNSSSNKELLSTLDNYAIDSLFQEELIKKIKEVQLEEEEQQNNLNECNTVNNNNNSNNNTNSANQNEEFKTKGSIAFSLDTECTKQESFQSQSSNKDGINTDSHKEICYSKHYLLPQNDKQFSTNEEPTKKVYLSYLDFNWHDNGLPVLKNLYSKGIQSLENQMTYVFNITSDSVGNKETSNTISTFQIRRAISYYIEKLHGYYHEDYNYANIQKLLDSTSNIRNTKFIKKFCFHPNEVTVQDLQEMNKIFQYEEIMHIILLIVFVKMKMQLTYLSKAFDDALKNMV